MTKKVCILQDKKTIKFTKDTPSSKTKDLGEKKIQLRQRLATTLIPNSAYAKVTNRMKPEGRNRWAATKVKVLSPVITIVPGSTRFIS